MYHEKKTYMENDVKEILEEAERQRLRQKREARRLRY